MKLKVIEHFLSVQGEGIYAGYPAIFLRVATCNQNCLHCDTRYSHSQGRPKDTAVIVSEILKYNSVKHLVITGGEPLLQQVELLELLLDLRLHFKHITVETNGSIFPNRELLSIVDFWSTSPKLKGMADYSWEPIINQYLTELFYKMQLKFVVITDDDYEEVKLRLQKLDSPHLSRTPIVFQPNGMSNTLNEYAKAYGDLALKVANDPFWKSYDIRVLMQNHRVAWKQKSGV